VCGAAYQRHAGAVWAARVLASGQDVVTCDDHALHFWEMASARPLSTFGSDGHSGGGGGGIGGAKHQQQQPPQREGSSGFASRFTSVKAVPASASLGFSAPGMASSASLTQCIATTTSQLLGIDLRCSSARRLFDWRVGGADAAAGGGFGDLLAGGAFGGGGVVNAYDAATGSSRLGEFGTLTACGVGFGSWRAAGGAGGKVRARLLVLAAIARSHCATN